MKKMKLQGYGPDKTIRITINGQERTLHDRDGEEVFVHSEPDVLLGMVTVSLREDSPKHQVHRSYLTND